MNPFTGIVLVARHAIRQTFGGGRFVGLLILLAIPLLISLVVLGAQKGDPARQFPDFARLVCFLIYQVEVPLLALILGVGVFGDEIEGRTITYLYTRPLPRPVIYLGRLLGYGLSFGTLLALCVGGTTLLFSRRLDLSLQEMGLTVLLGLGAFSVYLALFAALRTLFKRALLIGFLIAFIFEGGVSKFPKADVAEISIWRHVTVLFVDGMEDRAMPREFREMRIDESDPADSTRALLYVLAVTLALGMWQAQRREIRLPAAVA